MDNMIAQQFAITGELLSISPLRRGNINDTYVSMWESSSGRQRYLHQQVNAHVFGDVPRLMANFECITSHLRRQLERAVDECTVTIIPTLQGKLYLTCRSEDGTQVRYWRTLAYIEGTESLEACPNIAYAYATGLAFGRFGHLLSGIAPTSIYEPIAGFQHVPGRFDSLVDAVDRDTVGRVESAREEIDFALGHHDLAHVIDEAQGSGAVPTRMTHADPKINNILFKIGVPRVVAVVDLDTCMPGTLLYDFGDMVRSAGVGVAEDEQDLRKVNLNIALFDSLARGFIAGREGDLTATERELLPDAPAVIALSLGMRFLADYLEGDRYFRTAFADHNLVRARTQFAIVRSVLANRPELSAIVKRA